MSLFIRELSLYKKVLTLSLRVWTSTTLSNSLSRGLSLFLRVQTLRYRVIESLRVLFFTVMTNIFSKGSVQTVVKFLNVSNVIQ